MDQSVRVKYRGPGLLGHEVGLLSELQRRLEAMAEMLKDTIDSGAAGVAIRAESALDRHPKARGGTPPTPGRAAGRLGARSRSRDMQPGGVEEQGDLRQLRQTDCTVKRSIGYMSNG